MDKHRGKILVVDDDREMTAIISKVLSREKYHVLTAENGEEAFQLAAEHEPRVVIADWKMPECDGMNLIERLKKNYPKIKVIMITAFGEVEEYLEAMNRGAFEFLPKPLDIDELKSLVGRAVTEARG